MTADFKRSFERIIAARERLIELRGERIGQLLRLRMYLRSCLGDFLSNSDPVGGMRLAEIVADGSKANGDLALTLAFFDNSRLRIAVDKNGRFGHAASPDVFAGVVQILAVRVGPDLSSAELEYLPEGGEGAAEPQVTDFGTYVRALLEHVVASMEAQVASPSGPAALPSEGPRRGLSFSVR